MRLHCIHIPELFFLYLYSVPVVSATSRTYAWAQLGSRMAGRGVRDDDSRRHDGFAMIASPVIVKRGRAACASVLGALVYDSGRRLVGGGLEGV